MYSKWSYPFKLKLCVISVIYAACRAPEVLGIISVLALFMKGMYYKF